MAGALDRIMEDDQDREAHEHLLGECPWYRAVHGSLNATDPDEHCSASGSGKGSVPRLVVKLTAAVAAYAGNADEEAAMDDFRKVVFTSPRTQMTVMTLKPGEQIGWETHKDGDQLFVLLRGSGTFSAGSVTRPISGHAIFTVPQGTRHNVSNTGKELLKLVTVYAPPQHPAGTVEHDKAAAAREVKLTPRTPEASTVVKPTVPPGGPGLFHVKGMHLPPYMEHLWFHLVKRYGKHGAYRVANGIVHKWAQGINPGGWKRKGGGPAHVHADVQAAAARNIAEWEADRARAHSHVRATAGPDMTKSEAGYRKADTPEQRCGTCSMSSWGDGSTGTCSLVQGAIEKSHVCNHWAAEVKLAGALNMGTVSSPAQRKFESASSVAGKYSQYGLHQHPSQTVSPSPPLPPDVPIPSPAEVRALVRKVPDCSDISLSNSVKKFLETTAVKLEKKDEQGALFALRSAQAAIFSSYKADLGPYMASTLNAPGALSTTDARVVPAAQSSATAQMLQGRERQLTWRHLIVDVTALATRLRKKYFHGHINGVSPNLRLAEESSMTALGKIAAFSGAAITTGGDVSFPTETDTSQETRLINPPDSIQVSDFKAVKELASLPALSRIAIDAHLNSARDALRRKSYMAASQHLSQAAAAARAVDAFHLAKDLHRQLEALAEYGNRQHSEQDMSYRPLNQNSPQTTADTGNRKLSARLR